MAEHGINRRWLQAGVLAAGVGAAVVGGAGVAAAAPDDSTGDAPSASVGRSPNSATSARKPLRASANRGVGKAAAVRGASAATSASAVATRTFRSAQAAVPRVAPSQAVTASVTTPVAQASTQSPGFAFNLPVGPIRAAIYAAQAYIYGYPLMEYERVRSVVGPDLNTLYNLTTYANPDVDPIWFAIGGGKRPNVDTFYSVAELDLTNGPVVLSIPDMGDRYYSWQLTDPYINVSGYIGSNTTGTGPGQYAITWTGGPQVDVPGATVVEVPYASMLILGRTLAGDAADQNIARALIAQYTLTPTGATGPNNAVLPANCTGIAYLNGISDAITLNPPPAEDDAILANMAKIGVGTNLQVSDAHLGPLALLAADISVKVTAALLPPLVQLIQLTSAIQNHGWAIPSANIGNYGTDYVLRAGVAEVGLVANTQDEAMYEAGILGRWYVPLTAFLPGKSYTLHFDADQLPPAEAFWSVTVYDASGSLVPNTNDQYSVSSSRPAELVYEPDGSINIIFSRTDPGDPNSNWLALPFGGFSAYLRMYVPDQAAQDRTWTPPTINLAGFF
ncbi:MAG: DUF1254 domain-containing protein [Mycobacterium sp.]